MENEPMPVPGPRIVFMGTPEFAVGSLKAIVESGFQVVGVVTAPDKPSGRGQKISQSAVKRYASQLGLNIMQPQKLKDEDFLQQLKQLQADLQVVVAFRMLPEVVWKMPVHGTFNLHASLLPQYRGAAPINRAIMNGETVTGITTFFINHEIDTGAVLMREKVEIGAAETAGELHDRLMKKGAGLVVKTIECIIKGACPTIDQDELRVSGELKVAPKIAREDCRISWFSKTHDIFNFIRGLSPSPCAWTELSTENNRRLTAKVYLAEEAEAEEDSREIGGTGGTGGKAPGTIETDGRHYLKVATIDGYIGIKSIQLQ